MARAHTTFSRATRFRCISNKTIFVFDHAGERRSALRDETAGFKTVRSIAYKMQGSARIASPIHSRQVALSAWRLLAWSDVFIGIPVWHLHRPHRISPRHLLRRGLR